MILKLLLLVLPVAGGILAAIYTKKFVEKRFFPLLLNFSASFLLGVTVFHLLPELFGTHDHGIAHVEEPSVFLTGLFLLFGFFLQLLIDQFSRGVEHGHIHHHGKAANLWLIVISLSIHSLFDGSIVSGDHYERMIIPVMLHKFPAATVLASLILMEIPSVKSGKFYLMMAIFASSAPLGLLLTDQLHHMNLDHLIHWITAVVAGNFLHIAASLFLESRKEHKIKTNEALAIIIGFILAAITIWFH